MHIPNTPNAPNLPNSAAVDAPLPPPQTRGANTPPAPNVSASTSPPPAIPLDPRQELLIASLYESRMSTDMIDILVTLIKALSVSRQTRQAAWYSNAKANFNNSMIAAEHQRTAAKHQFTSDMLNHSSSMIQSGIDAASAAYGMGKMAQKKASITEKANERDFGHQAEPAAKTNATNPAGTNDGLEFDPDNKPGIDKRETPALQKKAVENHYESIKEVQADYDDAKAKLGKGASGADEAEQTAAQEAIETPEELAAREKVNKLADAAKQDWINQEMHSANMAIERKSKLISSLGAALGSLGHIGSGLESEKSNLENADAAAMRAMADYMHSLAGSEADWASELQAQFKAILQTLQAIDSARHQANTQLWS